MRSCVAEQSTKRCASPLRLWASQTPSSSGCGKGRAAPSWRYTCASRWTWSCTRQVAVTGTMAVLFLYKCQTSRCCLSLPFVCVYRFLPNSRSEEIAGGPLFSATLEFEVDMAMYPWAEKLTGSWECWRAIGRCVLLFHNSRRFAFPLVVDVQNCWQAPFSNTLAL